MAICSESEDWVDLSHFGNKEPDQEVDLAQPVAVLLLPAVPRTLLLCMHWGDVEGSQQVFILNCRLGEKGTQFCHFIVIRKLHSLGQPVLNACCFVDNCFFEPFLYNSARYGDLQGVVAALAQGGRVSVRNHLGLTPLLVAAQNGHTDICGLLLAHGSDVNEVDLTTKMTALHNAAACGCKNVVEALLSWGAIVDKQDQRGTTPLYYACQEGHLACVLALLEAKASVFVPTYNGQLPIHAAAYKNRVEIVKNLLDYGCSLDMVSCIGNIEYNNNNDILSHFR